jgi:hypothetical protein
MLAAGLTHEWWCPYFAGVAKSFTEILLLQHKPPGANADVSKSDVSETCLLLHTRTLFQLRQDVE